MNNQISSLEFSHVPVMLNEVLKISSPSAEKKFIDCTFGGGGYSKKFLDSFTHVKAIDRDKKALLLANQLKVKFPQQFSFYHIKFSQLDTISKDFAICMQKDPKLLRTMKSVSDHQATRGNASSG